MTTTYFVTRMVILLNFIGKNKYTFDCIIISNLKMSFIYWILEASNFQNVLNGVFTSLKTGIDSYLTEKMFILIIDIMWPRNFTKKKKSSSIIGRVKIKAKSIRHMTFT